MSEDAAWNNTLAKIEDLRNLPDDWDGDGAVKTLPGVIDTCLNFLGNMRPFGLEVPSVCLGPSGTVLLTWEHHGVYCELEVVGPNNLEWFSRPTPTPQVAS